MNIKKHFDDGYDAGWEDGRICGITGCATTANAMANYYEERGDHAGAEVLRMIVIAYYKGNEGFLEDMKARLGEEVAGGASMTKELVRTHSFLDLFLSNWKWYRRLRGGLWKVNYFGDWNHYEYMNMQEDYTPKKPETPEPELSNKGYR